MELIVLVKGLQDKIGVLNRQLTYREHQISELEVQRNQIMEQLHDAIGEAQRLLQEQVEEITHDSPAMGGTITLIPHTIYLVGNVPYYLCSNRAELVYQTDMQTHCYDCGARLIESKGVDDGTVSQEADIEMVVEPQTLTDTEGVHGDVWPHPASSENLRA